MGTILVSAHLHLGEGALKVYRQAQKQGCFRHFIPHTKPRPSLHSEEIQQQLVPKFAFV